MLTFTRFPGDAGHTTHKWKLVLAYDGTDFHGWQVQPGKRTIQGMLATALYQVTGEDVLPQGSGRTDAGVHAESQVVSVELTAPIPPERLLRAVNRRLPASIRVLSVEPAVHDFHARAAVAWKTYEYRIFVRHCTETPDERLCPPWQARYVWDCRWPLSLQAMQHAAGQVIGLHDFTSFAAHDPDRAQRIAASSEDDTENEAGGKLAPSNVREVFSSTWHAADGLLIYRISGTGFLHHMVRNLVGTFVEIGAGKREAGTIAMILSAKDRRLAGVTAPPQGLFLLHVEYRSGQNTEQKPYTGDFAMVAQ